MKPVIRWQYVRGDGIWSWFCNQPPLAWFCRDEAGFPEAEAFRVINHHLNTGYPASHQPLQPGQLRWKDTGLPVN